MVAQAIIALLAVWAFATAVVLGNDKDSEDAHIGAALSALQFCGLFYVFLTLL